MESFPKLAAELYLEIIRFAAEPDWNHNGPYYTTAIALCSVSFAFRYDAIRVLLKTVSLSSLSQLLTFIDAIHIQHSHRQTNSRLLVDYTKLVHQLWLADCWEPLPLAGYTLDYSALYQVMRNAKHLGLEFNSLHLLYYGLASAGACPSTDWNCRRVTFVGEHYRWTPLVMTTEGSEFLSRITHLILWIPPNGGRDSLGDDGDDDNHQQQHPRIPNWIQHIPFSSFSSLTHLAIPLIPSQGMFQTSRKEHLDVPTNMLVYSAPETWTGGSFDPDMFRKWAMSEKALERGTVIGGCRMKWGFSRTGRVVHEWNWMYPRGEGDKIWAKADRVRAATLAL